MLSAENISFSIGKQFLLREVDITFEKNRFHVIMGSNGAGKTTLLRLLAGNAYPSRGNVVFNGRSIGDFSKKELARRRAVLSQHYQVVFPITAGDIVMMGRYPHFKTVPSHRDHRICNEAMQLMEVEGLHERDYNTLSGGEAQKVQMSRVLAQIWEAGPGTETVLFLDEPVSHLDVKYQHQLLKVARERCNGSVTVIAILHDINLALSYGDRIIFLKHGKVEYDAGHSQEVTPDIVRRVFDVDARIMREENGKPVVIF